MTYYLFVVCLFYGIFFLLQGNSINRHRNTILKVKTKMTALREIKEKKMLKIYRTRSVQCFVFFLAGHSLFKSLEYQP